MVPAAPQEAPAVCFVGSGFSWSAAAPTDDLLVFTAWLGGATVDRSDPSRPAVWAGEGVPNRVPDHALARLTLPDAGPRTAAGAG
jgi:hypothetical protein